MGDQKTKPFHIAMYPWFAMGHLIPYLHLANKLAKRGHKISFFIPSKTLHKLEHLNLHPHLISFLPIIVPHVEGLPPGAETTADVPSPLIPLIMTAMDLTRPAIQASLQQLKPHLIFYDFTDWLPSDTRPLGIKAIFYLTINCLPRAYFYKPLQKKHLAEADFMEPHSEFPPNSSIKLSPHEARELVRFFGNEFGGGISLGDRILKSTSDSDAICIKSCREIEGRYCEYLEKQYVNKPVLLAGPVVPEPTNSSLEQRWAEWLDRFEPKTVIFCAFGSECYLKKDQLQELVLGFELTGLPFLAALQPPIGAENSGIESALPEGFEERNKGRGVVYGGWIQQQLILGHPSVGCFVSHCGSGSFSEGLASECQLVLLPQVGDQVLNARFMGGELKVGVEIEKGEENGLFTKESVCKAVQSVMEADSEVGKEVRENSAKLREILLSKGLENSYIDGLVEKLQELVIME